jgi:hypothetical protein
MAAVVGALVIVAPVVAPVVAPAARADTINYVTCFDLSRPVAISAIRVNSHAVSIGTWSPVAGVVHFYADGNGANGHVAFFAANLPANVHLYHLLYARLPHHYWISHVPYAGSTTLWMDQFRKFIPACHSRVVYLR